MVTYLDAILSAHREASRAERRDVGALMGRTRAMPPARDFEAALRVEGLSVIAEVKRRSPSKGDLDPALDPRRLARSYEAGGAACLSVLTDFEFFGGSADDLAVARSAVGLPVLRKDFTVSPADVCDARLMGADAVLLIALALSDAELADLAGLAADLGLAVLFEVHDEAELDRVMGVGARVVGVNQRDLHTFVVDPERAARVAARMPSSIVRVAESGISGPADARRLGEAGFDAVLVGESLVRSSDPAGAVAALRGRPGGPTAGDAADGVAVA